MAGVKGRSGGTNAKATAVKRQEGNPGKRELANDDIELPEIENTPPKHLTEYGLWAWDDIYPKLKKIPRLLAEIDVAILEQWCEAYGDFRRCSERLTDEGHFVLNRQDEVVLNPAFNARYKASDKMERLSRHLGLSPLDRAALFGRLGTFAGDGQSDPEVDKLLS